MLPQEIRKFFHERKRRRDAEGYAFNEAPITIRNNLVYGSEDNSPAEECQGNSNPTTKRSGIENSDIANKEDNRMAMVNCS